MRECLTRIGKRLTEATTDSRKTTRVVR